MIIASTGLPLLIFTANQVSRLISRATYKPANIVIETKNIQQPITRNWAAFAQGGEEPPPMLTQTIDKMRHLKPRYIRLDHIYDYYNVVRQKDNGFEYDFSTLDNTVNDILNMGALPFFSLSYMPSVFTLSGSVIDLPRDWNDWHNLVKATVEHYSGKNNKNLPNVYYEVWNEPDLSQFGSWKLGGGKDYRLLYFHAVNGATSALNVNKFFIGGPAVGSYYSNWVHDFISYVIQNQLRLDFYSWHRYNRKASIFSSDSENIRKNLAKYPKYSQLPLIISEWGIESDNKPINSSKIAAAFTVEAVKAMQNKTDLAFNFEVKDGPPPTGGGWGLLSHENAEPPLSTKPRFAAFEALNNLTGSAVSLLGDGSYIKGLVSINNKTINVIISNYDIEAQNSENVPVTFTGLDPASYILKYNYILDNSSGNYELISTDGTLAKSFLMTANSILSLELTPNGQLANFIPGLTNQAVDQALVLTNNESPLSFSSPEFSLESAGKISFDLKNFWEPADNKTFLIFEAPYPIQNGIGRLTLAKHNSRGLNFLLVSLNFPKPQLQLAIPINNWQRDSWHHLDLEWDQEKITLNLDNTPVSQPLGELTIGNGNILSFYPIEAAIDNLRIYSDERLIIERLFNGRVDR